MKEQAIVTYNKGISSQPSDYICEDGMLAECINMEVKDNELVPVQMPVKLPFSMEDGETLIHIHKIPNNPTKNYIYTYTSDGNLLLSAFRIVDGSRVGYHMNANIGDITSIESLGNTLVVYTSDSTHYFLFEGTVYRYLGNSIPKLSLSFGLSGKFEIQDEEESQTISYNRNDDYNEKTSLARDTIHAACSKFIKEYATDKNKFMYPFFVRYALVLANGEHVCHSSPVLLMPSYEGAPLFTYKRNDRDSDTYKDVFAVGGYIADLQYRVNEMGALNDWSDIIRGVDIFISNPVQTYDLTYAGIEYAHMGDYYMEGDIVSADVLDAEWCTTTQPSRGYKRTNIEQIYKHNGGTRHSWRGFCSISKEELIEKLISSSSIFYKYKSFNLSELSESSLYKTIENTSSLYTITQYETLTDDYMTNDKLIPMFTTVYNGRLNIANIKRVLYNGFKPEAMVQPLESYTDYISNTYNPIGYFDVYTYITTSSGANVVVKSSGNVSLAISGGFFFYPDTDAFQMVLHDTTNNRYVNISLSEHPGLNGAYAIVDSLTFKSGNPNITPSDEPYDYMENKLFTSDVNNPFYFPLAGINTVGNSKILGLSAMTRPISQGQFGEYPLVAFCSDGNYALRVDSNGYYAGVSPIQEDIVIGHEKITSLEDSIIVVTQRGLMLTTGGEIVKLAPQMDGGSFALLGLDGLKMLDEDFGVIMNSANYSEGFMTYLTGARIAYDYSQNRLFIYNPEKTFSYIYNFDNSTITKFVFGNGCKVVTSVLDYPDNIIQDSNGNLYSLYKKEDISTNMNSVKGVIITRPMKFGSALSVKSLFRVKNIHSGTNENSYVKYCMYGSNDNVKYFHVSSRFGKPYKFYRMVGYLNLLPKESFSGTTFIYEKRRTNKLR